jgi:hypothetical protein
LGTDQIDRGVDAMMSRSYPLMMCMLLLMSICIGGASANDIHGTYDDGTHWTTTNATSMQVIEAKEIRNVTGNITYVFDPALILGSFGFYVTAYLIYDDQVIYTHLIGDDPSDHLLVSTVGIGNMTVGGSVYFTSEYPGYLFSEGNGNYTLTVTMLIYSLSGYTNSSSVNAFFDVQIPNLLPIPHIPPVFIQGAGAVGIISLVLAMPAFLFISSRLNWILGLSALLIMLLVGWTLVNAFLLNSSTL